MAAVSIGTGQILASIFFRAPKEKRFAGCEGTELVGPLRFGVGVLPVLFIVRSVVLGLLGFDTCRLDPIGPCDRGTESSGDQHCTDQTSRSFF